MTDDGENNSDALDKTSIVQSDTFKVRIAEANQSPPCFVLLVGPAAQVGRQWAIQESDRIIGRAVGSYVFVDDRSLSKSHAKLILHAGEVKIIDLESTNKTLVNNKVLRPLTPEKLNNNDQVKMGNVIFKFLEKGNIETAAAAQTYDRGTTDALTGISNRGGLEEKGKEYFRKSDLLAVPLCVITFDIDHFKKINDTHGHSAGDYVLQELASLVSERLIRGNDFFARSGGEEFTLLLLGGSKEAGLEISERIRQTIEAHNFNYEGIRIPVTVSLGVSEKTLNDHQWKDILERADAALYVSKGSGRNQVNSK
ncbi:MAG: GGDEF domain-containing protein [Bdellovibrionales bacterium]|nr:GGDEF domain-containing protein [Bdellovibrionales bacterium]